MTLVRERRHQQSLRLSLPPPLPAADFYHRTCLPASLLATYSNSHRIDSLSNLEKLTVLGNGNGGTVYKVRYKKNGSVYALKVLRFDHYVASKCQQAMREAEIFRNVDSPYMVKCHAVFDNGCTDSNSGGDLCFVMEFMEGGSLSDVLRAYHRLPEQVISGLAKSVLEGLNYLHGMQIVHNDIKPSNLLVNDKGEVKIADFGVSEMMVGALEACDSNMGTSAYMSPERLDPERYGGEKPDGFAGDVWAVGVVVLECLVGHFPLIGAEQKPDWSTLMCAICFGQRLEIPRNTSLEFQSFVRRCLEKDWRRRGTVAELLDHPFVSTSRSVSTLGLADYILLA